MLCLALLSHKFNQSSLFEGAVHGLKLLAVVVVADATWGMYKSFCKQKLTSGLCLLTAAALLLIPSISTQIILLLLAAVIGCKYLASNQSSTHQRFKPSIWPLITFSLLIFALPLMTSGLPLIKLFSDFFQAGSLVFWWRTWSCAAAKYRWRTNLSGCFSHWLCRRSSRSGPMFTFRHLHWLSTYPTSTDSGRFSGNTRCFSARVPTPSWRSKTLATPCSDAKSVRRFKWCECCGCRLAVVSSLSTCIYQCST